MRVMFWDIGRDTSLYSPWAGVVAVSVRRGYRNRILTGERISAFPVLSQVREQGRHSCSVCWGRVCDLKPPTGDRKAGWVMQGGVTRENFGNENRGENDHQNLVKIWSCGVGHKK